MHAWMTIIGNARKDCLQVGVQRVVVVGRASPRLSWPPPSAPPCLAPWWPVAGGQEANARVFKSERARGANK